MGIIVPAKNAKRLYFPEKNNEICSGSRGLECLYSNIESEGKANATDYMGQQLGIALFKALHELPLPLRDEEMVLEALLANLLDQKFKQYNAKKNLR